MHETTPRRLPARTRPTGLRGHRVRSLQLAESRRSAILLAAARLFGKQGYDATTIDDIARDIGLTKGCIYYYFLSKEDIFYQIRTTAIRAAIDRLKVISSHNHSPDLTLHAVITDLITHTIVDPLERYANILHNPPSLSPERRRDIRNLQREYERYVIEIIQEGINTGIFVRCEPKLVAFTILRGALGVAYWYRMDKPWNIDFVANNVANLFVRSLLASNFRYNLVNDDSIQG